MADKYNIFTDVDLRGNSLYNVKDFNVSKADFNTIEVSESLTSENYTHLKNKVLINGAGYEPADLSTVDSIFKVATDTVEITCSKNNVKVTSELTEIVDVKNSTITTETHDILESLSCNVSNSFVLAADQNKSSMVLDTLVIKDNEINFGAKDTLKEETTVLDRQNYNVHIVWNSSTKSLVFQVEEN